jgi:hypothetical protein
MGAMQSSFGWRRSGAPLYVNDYSLLVGSSTTETSL